MKIDIQSAGHTFIESFHCWT